MSLLKFFMVEDDPWYGEMLKYHISLNPDYEVHLFENGKACLDQLHLRPDVITVDYSLPDMTGEDLFKKIHALNSDLPVIIISGQEEISIALNLLKVGVYDYIIKDDSTKEVLWNSLLHIKEKTQLKEEVVQLKQQLEQKFNFQKTMLGQSPAIKRIYPLIENAAKTNINVSITGETGTGKEVVAKAIHYNSNRKKKAFVAINMAAIPKDLVESELFGHEKGAFTGAVARKIGKFEEAHGGTIFLDEIAELELNMQVKLLRVLQEREVTRVGNNKPVKFDARILTATHKNLAEEVREGNFRKDLYYRIIGLPLELPPLRDRGDDKLILAKHFLEAFAKNNNMTCPILSQTAKDKLMQYHYPGNVRELKSIIELACVLSNGKEITEQDITIHALGDEDLFSGQEKTLRQYNADIINYFLKKYDNNVVEVAEKLDISKSTIYNMLKSGEVQKV